MREISARIGAIVPANNSVIEPEFWRSLPADVALYVTRILAKGDLTPAAVRRMEKQVDRAVELLSATGVDVMLYADMVTTFIMEDGWNEQKTAEIAESAGVVCLSPWTALRQALTALGVRRFALGTPYPRGIHALTRPCFERAGYAVTGDATLDILAMRDVPKVSAARLTEFVAGLRRDGAEAVVLLATDLPTFDAIEDLEQQVGLPLLTSNQTLLWAALRALGRQDRVPGLGRLFDA